MFATMPTLHAIRLVYLEGLQALRNSCERIQNLIPYVRLHLPADNELSEELAVLISAYDMATRRIRKMIEPELLDRLDDLAFLTLMRRFENVPQRIYKTIEGCRQFLDDKIGVKDLVPLFATLIIK